MDILEGNKLIKDFMNHTEFNTLEDKLQYHSSWGWLMPVVEKIEGMGFHTIIGKIPRLEPYCNINFKESQIIDGITESKVMGQCEKKIDAVWSAVIQFIQWYTTQSTKPND